VDGDELLVVADDVYDLVLEVASSTTSIEKIAGRLHRIIE
jgi:hypothetical protein